MVTGHGGEAGLSLGKIKSGEKDDVFYLDTSDGEIEGHLQHLHKDAVIFLYSCSTAEGGKENEKNLANRFVQWADGRVVVAAMEILYPDKVTVHSFYPFDATLLDKTGKKDITYRNFLNAF